MLKQFTYLLLVFTISTTQAQQKTITGIVSDNSGILTGVLIKIKGAATGTESDFDGKYTLNAKVRDTLLFTYLGYKQAQKIVGKSNVIHVKMIEQANSLDEIVVVGYGSEAKRGFTSAVRGVSVVDGTKSYSHKIIENYKPQSGQLTAGEINDFENWLDWKKLFKNKDFIKVKNQWNFNITNYIEVFVKDINNKPITNAIVLLLNDENIVIGKTKTDVFGKAILFREKGKYHTVQAIYNNEIKGLKVTSNHQKTNFTFLESVKNYDIDIMFTIDATGSMGDEIDYLKSEIENIINRVDKSIQSKRVGLTFYRDIGDAYVVKDFDFTTNIKTVKHNLSQQYASGGGDYEEAVEKALQVSLSKSWNEKATAKLLFLLLDAPPHYNQENVKIIKNAIKTTQEKGIKIIPIVASGADKTVEFLMRFFSVSTNGTYVFLTDDRV
ncbi:VWA domain-containing protein [Polaribacter aestuariivivens]|uniref:vWA domain-containing protein n=1 Tax=Polaribacter aestuariivivens TaxID=2304626 RepID=UPI003F498902